MLLCLYMGICVQFVEMSCSYSNRINLSLLRDEGLEGVEAQLLSFLN
jgi:hypothetical protein